MGLETKAERESEVDQTSSQLNERGISGQPNSQFHEGHSYS